MGLDIGARRIGIAVSDPLGITAQGLETLHRKNKKYDFSYLHRLIRDYNVGEMVVGLPLRMSGAEGIQSGKVHAFAEELRKHFKILVHLGRASHFGGGQPPSTRNGSVHREARPGRGPHGRHPDPARVDGQAQAGSRGSN